MAGQAYGVLAEEMASRFLDVLPPAIERLHWDRERLAAFQRAQLHETLAFVAERSRWHASRLAGIDLDAVGLDDLSPLPVMTKRGLMANWDDVVTDARLNLALARSHLTRLDEGPAFLLAEYHVLTTGGSTGEPGMFCWSRDELVRWLASVGRWTVAGGQAPPQRTAWIGARSLRHPSAAFAVLLAVMSGGTPLTVPLDQPLGEIVARLNELQPDSLWVVSSMLPALVLAAREGSLRIDVKAISVGGDPLDPGIAATAADVFEAPVIEGYPTTDAGQIAQQVLGEAGLYVNEDFLIVEPVDEEDQPVAPGEDSHHVLVTSLHQRTLPLIRYRIDDRLRIDTEGGRYQSFRRIATIDGRSDDLFEYGAVRVHPHAFRAVFARHDAIKDYQVTQTSGGADVAVAATLDLDECAVLGELVGALGRAGLPNAEVVITVHDELPRTAVGKRLRFVPMR